MFAAPFAVFIMNDKRNYFEPDILVSLCIGTSLDEAGCQRGAPDWVIEIVSPSSRTMDLLRKAGKNAEAGVREYWIVDPAREVVVICRMEKGEGPVICPFTDRLVSGSGGGPGAGYSGGLKGSLSKSNDHTKEKYAKENIQKKKETPGIGKENLIFPQNPAAFASIFHQYPRFP